MNDIRVIGYDPGNDNGSRMLVARVIAGGGLSVLTILGPPAIEHENYVLRVQDVIVPVMTN